MTYHIAFGKKGEEEAANYLKSLGYKIIQKNFKCKLGEIDIIAKDNEVTVFAEVKSRSSNYFGTPAEAIGYKKLHSIVKTAQFYLLTHRKNSDRMRIDAIEVLYENAQFKITHIKNITL